MKILLVGGGSIGHVAPAVAVWRALKRAKPDAELKMICSEEQSDAEFLKKEGIPFTAIRGRRFSPLRPDIFLGSFFRARRIIKEFSPDVVFSKGGALSVPVCLAAKIRGIPIVLHESDAVMGKANRLIARWAKTVCRGFPGEGVFTGNPVRPVVTAGNKEEGLRITGFSGTKPVLLVMGGSQGARAINDVIAAHIDALLQIVDVIHLTGPGKGGIKARPGYFSLPFAYGELPHLYAISDLALSRSGAGGISELAACGIPSLLVPLRGLAQDHQLHNAVTAEKSGGAKMLDQETLGKTLLPALTTLAGEESKLSALRTAILTLYVPDAAQKIADEVLCATLRKK